ncbi:MAG: YihY/virulence factor BrkB family protein [Gemmatimonadetes bacterium]|nr:YihY/virulence factor BrkB family protein [Gemmatimonadota bacterium]MCB9518318.1 YihY/virulence factor BrkB family protein [Gemmatimonadales bacterium]HPF63120.1 YihY/virulence factor BrkB family protein [Gemmatimonadales bacterium]HRX18193.1 YihY/virulence factor BrkB family protein [Gemmatimonadales bacterium]
MTTDPEQEGPDESPPSGGLSGVLPHVPPLVTRVEAVVERAHIPLLASALTFDALLALVPLGLLMLQGLGLVLRHTRFFDLADPDRLLLSLLPPHAHGVAGRDPFALVEGMVGAIQGYQSQVTWLAIPAFLWFGSRLFSSIRSTLSEVYDAQGPQRHEKLILAVLLDFVFGKLRDFAMMGFLLALALVNTVLTALVRLGSRETSPDLPLFDLFASALGRVLGEAVAIGSAVVLFMALYRYASPRRLSWKASAFAAAVATVGFELAKRLYGLYLTIGAQREVYTIDVNLGAVMLFLLWVWWAALVFLLGAAAADVWERGRSGSSGKRDASSEKRG